VPERDTARTVGRLLTVGTLVSVVLAAVGVLLMVAGGHTPIDEPGPPFDPARAVAGLAGGQAATWIWIGLIAAVALPSGRVALAFVGFLQEGNRRQAAIALGVLAILSASLAVALATR
jgi:uncharacterized membrane protein